MTARWACLLVLSHIGCSRETAAARETSLAPLSPEAVQGEDEPEPTERSMATSLSASTPSAEVPAAPACPPHLRCDFDALKRDPTLAIDGIRVEKAAHALYLLAGETAVKRYRVALGWGGAGPKRQEGDGVTPVGSYKLTGRLATSPWHVLIGVSYPNYEDVKRFAAAKRAGEVPANAAIGFGIALHGRRRDALDGEHKNTDWTAGCIAVDNPEIEEIAGLVKTGTPIVIVD